MTMDPQQVGQHGRDRERGPDPADPALRWFHGRDATSTEVGQVVTSPPREVLEVIRYLRVVAALQIVVAGVIALLAIPAFGPVPAIVTGAIVAATASVSFLTAWRLSRGSDRARRFVAWPLEDDSWLFASTSWVRTRLRTPRAQQWFANARRERARRSDGPQ